MSKNKTVVAALKKWTTKFKDGVKRFNRSSDKRRAISRFSQEDLAKMPKRKADMARAMGANPNSPSPKMQKRLKQRLLEGLGKFLKA